jgi:hypothetical protein
MHPRRTGAGVKAQEHRALGDEASASAKVNLGGDSAEERFEVRFGDVVALSGDYFYPTAEPALDPQAAALGPEVLASGGLFALAAVPGHEGTAVGTRDEVICALRVMAADQGLVDPRFGSGGEFAHFRFSATASETEVEQRQGVGKGRMGFLIPRRLPDAARWPRHALVREQGHQREQAEQRRGGAGDRQVRPLPLRLHAEVLPCFLEGDLQLPALDEPRQDLLGRRLRVGAEQGLRLELAPRIADQHPAEGHRRQAAVIPHGGV